MGFFYLFWTVGLTLSSIGNVFAQEIRPGAPSPLQIGVVGAKLRIEIFNDYQCLACAHFDDTIVAIHRKYPKDVLVVFRNFPLSIPAHKNNYEAAIAVEAAGMQGKFREMMGLVYKNILKWSDLENPEKSFRRYARQAGLDLDKFSSDYHGIVVRARIDSDLAKAKSLKLNSTPTVFLNDRQLSFAESGELEALIEQSIKEKRF